MNSFISSSIKSVLGKLNISIISQNNLVRLKTNRIGARGAAESFAYYALHSKELSQDRDLEEFMSFYAKHWKESASQCSQDIFALYANKFKKKGRFLEIGGADGFINSNTYMLEKYHEWTGILIEPDINQFMLLEMIRHKCDNINAAISPKGKEEYLNLRQVGQLSSLAGHEGVDRHKENRFKSNSFVKVKAVNLSVILRQNKVDYFSLDVEGAELEILRNIDWGSIKKPSSITIEHNFRQPDRQALVEILKRQGYKELFPKYDWLRKHDIWVELEQ